MTYKLLTSLVLEILKAEHILLVVMLRVWELSIIGAQALYRNGDLKPCASLDDCFDITLERQQYIPHRENPDYSEFDSRIAEYRRKRIKHEGGLNTPSMHQVKSISAHKRSNPVPGTKKNGDEGSPDDGARCCDAWHESRPQDIAGFRQLGPSIEDCFRPDASGPDSRDVGHSAPGTNNEDKPLEPMFAIKDWYGACSLERLLQKNTAMDSEKMDSEKLDPKELDSETMDRIDGV